MSTCFSLRFLMLFLAVLLPACTPAAQELDASAEDGTATGSGASCPVQGTWLLESASYNGEAQPEDGWQQIKVVSSSHFAWVGQRPGPQALQSVADSLAAYRTRGFGGGPYQVAETTYTEQLEYFFDPAYVGAEASFTCRVDGDRWYHAGELPMLEDGREVGRTRLEEVWRRIGAPGAEGSGE